MPVGLCDARAMPAAGASGSFAMLAVVHFSVFASLLFFRLAAISVRLLALYFFFLVFLTAGFLPPVPASKGRRPK